MLASIVLALTTGTAVTLGILALFALIGLIAIARTDPPEGIDEDFQAARYVFGLGKNPRLRRVPGDRDVPATPKPLGGPGLKDLAADASTRTRFTVNRYRLPDGRTAPYDLSEDLPQDIRAVEFEMEDVRVWIDNDGEVSASRALDQEELEELETLLEDQVATHPRADRRNWSPPQHSPGDANRARV